MRKINPNTYLVGAVIMMGILFYSSSQTYHEQTTVPLLQEILKNKPFAGGLANVSFLYGGQEVSIEASGYFKFVEFFIRKFAHFMTYFIMGFCLYKGLASRIKERWLLVPIVYLSCVGYAGLDEFHQSLTGGRTPSFSDVVLDGFGALCAALILVLFSFYGKKRKRRR